MKKRNLILLSLIPFALSACENEAEKNKKISNIVDDLYHELFGDII